jgi:hypothetical protein
MFEPVPLFNLLGETMTETQFKTLRTLLGLIVVGLFALAASNVIGSAVPEAHADDASWTCYVTDRLGNPGEAEEWKGARTATRALNFIAADVPPGNITSFPVFKGDGAYVLCAK